MKAYIALGLLAVLILIGPASAISVYNQFIPITRSAAPGETLVIPLAVGLDSNESKTTVEVSSTSMPAIDISTDPQKFRICPGQVIPVTVTLTIPPETQPGSFDAMIMFKSLTGPFCKKAQPVVIPISINVTDPAIRPTADGGS